MQVYINDISLVSGINSKETSVLVSFVGCDFRCPYCNKHELLEFKKEFQKGLKEVKAKIREYVGLAAFVVFSGAEPCLQRQALLNLVKYCKEIGFKVVLKTNGGSPSLLNALIKNELIDKVRLEFKSPLNAKAFKKITSSSTFFKTNKEVMNNFKKSLEIIKRNQNKVGVVFRTLIVPGLIYKKEDILDIAKLISKVDGVWVLQQFINENVKGVLKNIRKPSLSFLENLKEVCMKEYPNLRIIVAGS